MVTEVIARHALLHESEKKDEILERLRLKPFTVITLAIVFLHVDFVVYLWDALRW